MNTILIVGLGNPGEQYQHTRHNVGFMTVDAIASENGFPEFAEKGNALITANRFGDNNVVLLKPQTFMNLSGKAVGPIVSFFKIPNDNIIVIHDDLDVKVGSIKVKQGGSAGGHNGLKSIDSFISNNYWRVRIGIGRPKLKNEVVDYVLNKLNKDELSVIGATFDRISHNLKKLLIDKNNFIQAVSNNQFNQ